MNPVEPLHDAIRRFIEQAECDFEDLALRLFAHQYEHNIPYRRFCDGRGVAPTGISSWKDIPPAPAAAFKHFALTCAPESECIPVAGGRTFHSSGTTGEETSRHFMDSPALACYRSSLRRGYVAAVPRSLNPLPLFALMPPSDDAPHSSLSYMLGDLIAEYGGEFYWGDNWAAHLTQRISALSQPVTVFGTAFAWVHFLDSSPERTPLPPGSVVLETGGFKGRSREVSREELYALFNTRLGVPSDYCLSEYGMSEMASQFYSTGDGPKVGPPWVRTRVLNPITGQDALPGESGLLAHYDLANTNSVLALQTEDMGVAIGDGFQLLGRAPGAVLRGCSLTAEDLFFTDQH